MEKKQKVKEKYIVIAGIVFYFAMLVRVALFTNGTCDSGDSIFHYLFARYAFVHPANFLDHWAKPLFVLLSTPFAQFGFIGIKIFNCVVGALSLFFGYKTAKALSFDRAWLAPVFLGFSSGWFIHLFSGLTEPLFGLLLITGIYLAISGNLSGSAIVTSFLPFIRSEGLIIIILFAFYFIINKQYKYVLWLLTGHVVYSIIGAFYYHDMLWVFTRIPYRESSGKYGNGNLLHFVVQLTYITGIPLYVLLGAGFTKKISNAWSKNKQADFFTNAETWLIYILLLAFVAAHSLFWYLGIFESMGLKRVLVAVVPVIAIIAVQGFNFLLELAKGRKIVRTATAVIIGGYVLIFPFTANPAAIDWKRDLSLSPDEVLVEDATKYIQSLYAANIYMYHSHPYFYITMNRDPFSKTQNATLKDLAGIRPPTPYVVIWESKFSEIENGTSLEQLKADTTLQLLKYFNLNDGKHEASLVVFGSKH